MNLIFDIGFNTGKFTQACFEKYPACQIVAVEANPHLCKNIPNTDNFVLLNYLVSSESNKEIDFYVSYKYNGISTASTKWKESSRFAKGSKYVGIENNIWDERPIPVKSITLDLMIETYGVPDFIKIDVEGYELEVLSGLTHKAKVICFEWTEENTDTLLKCINHLESIGYSEFCLTGYFDEGNVFEEAVYSIRGDDYLLNPQKYLSVYNFKQLVNKVCNSDRRVNYGMVYVK